MIKQKNTRTFSARVFFCADHPLALSFLPVMPFTCIAYSEGDDLQLVASKTGRINERVQQLRDPGVFDDQGQLYLLYSIAGEAGIATASLNLHEE